MTYCCSLKQQTSFHSFEAQESGCGFAGCGSGRLVRLQSGCRQGPQAIQGWTKAGGSTPKLTRAVAGRPQVLPEAQLLVMRPLRTAATRRREASPQPRDPRKRRTKTEAKVFNNLISETAYHLSCHILSVTQTNSSPRWEGILHKDENVWRQESSGAMLEAGCHTVFFQNVSTKAAKEHDKHGSRMWSRGLG